MLGEFHTIQLWNLLPKDNMHKFFFYKLIHKLFFPKRKSSIS